MFPLRRFKVRSYEMGLYFRNGEFQGLLGAGRQAFDLAELTNQAKYVDDAGGWNVGRFTTNR